MRFPGYALEDIIMVKQHSGLSRVPGVLAALMS